MRDATNQVVLGAFIVTFVYCLRVLRTIRRNEPLEFVPQLSLAGWINRHQQAVIEYLQAENQSLRNQVGNKRIRWTDAQRRRLAEKANAIGRSTLAALGTVVTLGARSLPTLSTITWSGITKG